MSSNCDICVKSYQQKGTRHRKYKHDKDVVRLSNIAKMAKCKSIKFWNEKVACEYCPKKINRKNMKMHIKRIHQRANLQATQKAYANQQANQQANQPMCDDQVSQRVYTVDGVDPKVSVVDTTQQVTGTDTTVYPFDDSVAIVDQFIEYITGDQSEPENSIVQCLLKETYKELWYKPNYYIMMGNVWRLAFNSGRKFPLLDFIDELTGTVRHDFDSQYDFEWMVQMFAMGRELLRRMPSYRLEVKEMLRYFLCRADGDLTKIGGLKQFNDNCTKYKDVLTL